MSKTLSSLVDSLVKEAIRSSSFNLDVFKGLKTMSDRLDYAEENLKEAGSGGSRSVFLLSSKKVLKMARNSGNNNGGVTQNLAEVENSQTIPEIVTKVFDSSPDGSWLIAELVRPLRTDQEFASLTGFDFGTMMNFVYEGERFLQINKDKPNVKAFMNWQGFPGVVKTVKDKNKGLHEGDFSILKHWGKTADGRVVLLDHGATNDYIKSLYPGMTSEGIMDVLKGKEDINPSLSHTQQQHLVLAQGVEVSLQGLHDKLEQSRIQLEVVREIIGEVEGRTKSKLPVDTTVNFSIALKNLAQQSIEEYQEHLKSKIESDVVPVNESLTIPTVASFTFGAARNLGNYLLVLEELARQFKAPKLLKGLRVAGMVARKVGSKGGSSMKYSDEASLAIYKSLWDRGFQSSKTFLGNEDYLSGVQNARLVSEGLFYKLSVAFYSFQAIQYLLSTCVAYLREAQADLGTNELLTQVYSKLSPTTQNQF